MIVDAHTHMPEDLAEHPQVFAEYFCRHGVGHAVVSGTDVLWKKGCVSEHNDRLARFCMESDGVFVPLATVHLAEGATAVREARRCLDELGVRGFKLHPWLQGESMTMSTMGELCRLAGDAGVPILFHDGTPPYALPSQVGHLAGRFPGTTFVLGHAGILHFWEEALLVGQECPNVFLTLCGPHPWAMQRICDAMDVDRLLWGSDFGFGLNEAMLTYRLALPGLLCLAPDTRDALMGGNAQRLFRL